MHYTEKKCAHFCFECYIVGYKTRASWVCEIGLLYKAPIVSGFQFHFCFTAHHIISRQYFLHCWPFVREINLSFLLKNGQVASDLRPHYAPVMSLMQFVLMQFAVGKKSNLYIFDGDRATIWRVINNIVDHSVHTPELKSFSWLHPIKHGFI